MSGKLNLKLYGNNTIIFNAENVNYIFDNSELNFSINNEKYNIKTSLNNNIFIKENDESIFTLDISNKECNYLLKEINKSFDINVLDSLFIEENNLIKIAEENKEKLAKITLTFNLKATGSKTDGYPG